MGRSQVWVSRIKYDPIIVEKGRGGVTAVLNPKGVENLEMEEGLKRLGKKAIIFNACGKFNLSQSASLVKQAEVVFGHDTGLTHIAAAFKKTIFSIWGGTVPNNFYPYGTRFYLIENTKLTCRPCSKSGRSKCPKGHFKCMNDLTFDFNIP